MNTYNTIIFSLDHIENNKRALDDPKLFNSVVDMFGHTPCLFAHFIIIIDHRKGLYRLIKNRLTGETTECLPIESLKEFLRSIYE